jgi:hypothetical protein
MSQKPAKSPSPSERLVRDIRRDPPPELGPCKTGNFRLVGCGERRRGARKRLKRRRGGVGQKLQR